MQNLQGRVRLLEKKNEIDKDLFSELPDPEVLKGSLFKFSEYFYHLLTGQSFINRPGQNRASFLDTLIPVFERIAKQDPEYHRTAIRCPPRYGKSVLVLLFLAWVHARNPKCKSIYVCYNFQLAVKQTKFLKRIMTLPEYQKLFGMKILHDSRSSFDFEFDTGGQIYGAGAGGTIVGTGAGLFGDDFGGVIIMDDIQKPSDVTSEKYRQSTRDWFQDTLSTRTNDKKTPIVGIGHAIHEDDLLENLLGGDKQGHKIDQYDWKPVILPALDTAGNALMPDMHSSDMLLKMKETSRYVFASQFQQNPVASGVGLFLEEDFKPLLDDIPNNIEATFLTVDTAETDKTYNDPTVFSFWGIYKIRIGEHDTGMYGIHWIDCAEMWIEPKDLQDEFLSFYNGCLRFEVKPSLIAIEKKSTGVTLSSTLKQIPGLRIVEIERTRASGNKSSRFIEMQSYIAQKRMTLHSFGKHTSMCIEHMSKITANVSHRFDDICDTAYDAVRMALIDETVINLNKRPRSDRKIEGYKAYSKKSFTTWNQT